MTSHVSWQPRPWSLQERGCSVLAFLSFHRTFTISVEYCSIFTLQQLSLRRSLMLWWFRQRHHLLYSPLGMTNSNCLFFFQGLCSLQIYWKCQCYGILLLWYMTKGKLRTNKLTKKKPTTLPAFIYPHKKHRMKWVHPFKEIVQLCFIYYKWVLLYLFYSD